MNKVKIMQYLLSAFYIFFLSTSAMEQDLPTEQAEQETMLKGMTDFYSTVNLTRELLKSERIPSDLVNKIVKKLEDLLDDPTLSDSDKKLIRSLQVDLYISAPELRPHMHSQFPGPLEEFESSPAYELEEVGTRYMGDY